MNSWFDNNQDDRFFVASIWTLIGLALGGSIMYGFYAERPWFVAIPVFITLGIILCRPGERTGG